MGEIVKKYQRDYDSLSNDQKALIPTYEEKLRQVLECSQKNQEILSLMINDHLKNLDPSIEPDRRNLPRERAQENLRSLLRQIVRDWSEEGQSERQASYGPILDFIKANFKAKKSILVPGAGLGRLVYEISQLGHDCQGNEFSLFMLLPSEWILNSGLPVNSVALHPWILPFSNQTSLRNQFRQVRFPDASPAEPANGGTMSITAGDFLQVYTDPSKWDVVVTCFFLDTAKNIIEYIRRIHQILCPGGIWINHGPLLYHFEGSRDISIELSLDEVKHVIEAVGFIIKAESFSDCPYTQDQHSMLRTTYGANFMILEKAK